MLIFISERKKSVAAIMAQTIAQSWLELATSLASMSWSQSHREALMRQRSAARAQTVLCFYAG